MTKVTYRVKEDQNLWNMLFSVFFLAVFILSMAILIHVRGSMPHAVPFFDALLMLFATFRITRLIVYDKITRFFREWFVDTREVEHDGESMIEITPSTYGIRGTIHDLLGCPWCIGIWSSLTIIFCYFAFNWAWYVIFVLGLSSAATLLQLVANAIGWKAENLKLEAHHKEHH